VAGAGHLLSRRAKHHAVQRAQVSGNPRAIAPDADQASGPRPSFFGRVWHWEAYMRGRQPQRASSGPPRRALESCQRIRPAQMQPKDRLGCHLRGSLGSRAESNLRCWCRRLLLRGRQQRRRQSLPEQIEMPSSEPPRLREGDDLTSSGERPSGGHPGSNKGKPRCQGGQQGDVGRRGGCSFSPRDGATLPPAGVDRRVRQHPAEWMHRNFQAHQLRVAASRSSTAAGSSQQRRGMAGNGLMFDAALLLRALPRRTRAKSWYQFAPR
jgi:hypothetical protein